MKQKILVINDGSDSEVIASLPLAHALSNSDSEIYFLGNNKKGLLSTQPHIKQCLSIKEAGALDLVKRIRNEKFAAVYNLSRNKLPAFLTILSKAKFKAGFQVFPFSFYYNKSIPWITDKYIGSQYLNLVGSTDPDSDFAIKTTEFPIPEQPYFVIAPFHEAAIRNESMDFWKLLINRLPEKYKVYIIGSKADSIKGNKLRSENIHVENICGKALEYYHFLIKNSFRTFTNQNKFLQFAPSIKDKIVLASKDCDTYKKYIPNGLFKYISTREINHETVLQAFNAVEYRKAISDTYTPTEKIVVAIKTLKDGGIIVQETDTIPGISGLAINKEAVNKIHAVKGRDPSKAMLILCSNIRMVKNYVTDIPEKVFEVMDKAGDLPLTIIYPFGKNLPDNLLAEDKSIGIRIPENPVLQNMINTLGFPVISTSANFSGEKAPIKLSEISQDLLAKIDFILDVPVKNIQQNSPSTILKIRGEEIEIIRTGEMSENLKGLLQNI